MRKITAGSPIRKMAFTAGAVVSVALALIGCAPFTQTQTTSTPTTTVAHQPRLYVTTYRQPTPPSSGQPVMRVVSVSPDNGSIQWQVTSNTLYPFHQASSKASGERLYVISDTIPTKPTDTSKPTGFLSALMASDSHTLWKIPLGAFISTPVVSNDTLYTSAITYSGQGDPNAQSKWLYALHASDGTKRWQTQIPGVFGLNDDITLVDGVLYVTSNEVCFDSCQGAYLFAVRASDGKLLWKDTIPGNLNISTAEIDHGVVFLSIPSYDLNYGMLREIVAYDAANGVSLWSRITYLEGSSSGAPEFVAANGLIYTGLANPVASDPYRPDHWSYGIAALDGRTGALKWQTKTNSYSTIDAHDAQALYVRTITTTSSGSVANQSLAAYALADGSRRWQVGVDLNLEVVALQDGALYGITLDIKNEAASQVETLSASTGALRWRTPITVPPTRSIAGSPARPYVIMDGVLYMTLSSTTLDALQVSDGHILWQKTFDSGVIGLQTAA